MEVLTEAPRTSSFIPLAEHQSATPASFYTGPPVLHYYSDRCQILVLESEAAHTLALSNLVSKAPARAEVDSALNGTDPDAEQRKVIEDVDVWVTSDTLLMWSNSLETGLSIPYPTISLHAIQSLPEPSAIDTTSQGLYMQLVVGPDGNSNTTQSEDVDLDSVSVTVIPTASAPPPQAIGAPDPELAGEDQPEQTPVQAMFAALSECSNLHPDPEDEEDMGMGMAGPGSGDNELEGSTLYQSGLVAGGSADGGLPPPMPGSGGWITAENMHEYLDAEGNWIGPEDGDGDEDETMADEGSEALGPGAGTTRQRDGHDADGNGEDETKWRRTD